MKLDLGNGLPEVLPGDMRGTRAYCVDNQETIEKWDRMLARDFVSANVNMLSRQ